MFPQTFKWKNPYFRYIRCYTYIQIFLHKLHLYETPSLVFINRLKGVKFSVFLNMLFHIFGPRTFKLFSPNFTWLARTTFKFRFCWLGAGLSNNLTSNMFDIKHGFNWCRVFNSSGQGVLNIYLVIVDLFEFSENSP